MRPRNFIDISGQRFGALIAERAIGYRPGGMMWECLCDCGKRIVVNSRNLRIGRTKSCGCMRAQRISARLLRHGQARRGARSALHRVWSMMLDRCENPRNSSFKHYGALGVKVCERWHKFEHFLADMGERPSPKHSIDRFPDNRGDYEPGNCRWATALEQRHNRRDCRKIAA